MYPALPPGCQRTSLSYLGVLFVSFLPFFFLLSFLLLLLFLFFFFFFFFPLSEEDDEEEEELSEEEVEEEEDFSILFSCKEGAAVTWSSLFASAKAETSKTISTLLVLPIGV